MVIGCACRAHRRSGLAPPWEEKNNLPSQEHIPRALKFIAENVTSY